jgi:hypothetical protein
MPKRRPRRASAHASERALAAQEPEQGPTASTAARQPHLSEGVMFPPGEPLMPVAGVTTPDGAPRQWAYPVGYNIA